MDNKESLATWSLLLGIIGLILSFFLGFLILPLIIIGIVLGIVNVTTGGKKFAGIIVNSIAFIINLIWSFFLIFMLLLIFVFNVSKTHYNKFILNDTDNISILGEWNCYLDSSEDYVVSIEFNDNNEFLWSKYDDKDNNHVFGDYVYVKNNLYLDGREFVVDGIVQDSSYHANYDVSYDEGLVLFNNKSNNRYYCKINKD